MRPRPSWMGIGYNRVNGGGRKAKPEHTCCEKTKARMPRKQREKHPPIDQRMVETIRETGFAAVGLPPRA